MKSMNRRENKKIAVMAAVIMGSMVIAFMPMASAQVGVVTDFTVTPSTGIAGAVDSYNVLVTTQGVSTIDITIPAGFIAVAPMSGGVEIARVDFWNSSTKAYYGHATITSNKSNPTGLVDIYCEAGGDTITKPQLVDYAPGATNWFDSGFGDTSLATITLPTKTAHGSIEIYIDPTAFQLEDVHIALKQFVRNPAAGTYDKFSANGVPETVTITEPLVYPTVYKDDLWFVDSDGNLIADICFLYKGEGPSNNRTPLVGDLFGCADSLIIYDDDEGMWSVDTNHDRVTDYYFKLGGPATPLVGDVNQDGIDDLIAFNGGLWFYKYGETIGTPSWGEELYWEASAPFLYGAPGSIPLIGDVDRDPAGFDDRVVVTGSAWYVDTTANEKPNFAFLYGGSGTTPLVGDVNQDGLDDVVIFGDGLWFIDTNNYDPTIIPRTASYVFLYGTTGMIPLVGEIR